MAIGRTNANSINSTSEGTLVQKTCSQKSLGGYPKLYTSGNEIKVCDATFKNSININGYEHFYFATITASKMYINGEEIPQRTLTQIGSISLYYGSSGQTLSTRGIYIYRDGNILYFTFDRDRNTIKISYNQQLMVSIYTITFSSDMVIAKEKPSFGAFTSYARVYGETGMGNTYDYKVYVPNDATKLLDYIFFTYDDTGDDFYIGIKDLTV